MKGMGFSTCTSGVGCGYRALSGQQQWVWSLGMKRSHHSWTAGLQQMHAARQIQSRARKDAEILPKGWQSAGRKATASHHALRAPYHASKMQQVCKAPRAGCVQRQLHWCHASCSGALSLESSTQPDQRKMGLRVSICDGCNVPQRPNRDPKNQVVQIL